MISDLLGDALSEIEDYQWMMPGVYSPFRDQIESVKAAMHRLMVLLDAPPVTFSNEEATRKSQGDHEDTFECEECHEMLPRDEAEEVGDLIVCEECAGLLTVCDNCGEVARDEDCEYGPGDCDDLLCPDCFEALAG